MKKKNWKIQIWNKQKNKLLFMEIVNDQIKPIAMNESFNNFIFKHAINELDDLNHLEFVIVEL